ncbi:hypothetical protein Srufu_025940 [Streptomyces libani subsp. rufus]|nr:hypothetical protein Srufu_025940 [Streptomyces libani subsp. rufus]
MLEQVPADGRGRSIRRSALAEYRVMGVRGPAGDVLVTGLTLQPVVDTVSGLELVEAVVGEP